MSYLWADLAWVDNFFLCEGRMDNLIYTIMLEYIIMDSDQKKIGKTDRATIYFQQYNAPCYTSGVSRGCLASKELKDLDLPPQSPD